MPKKVKGKFALDQATKAQRGRSSILSLTSVLEGGEYLTPRPGCFTHCVGGWVGPRASRDGWG
jgi:hypothetical protein